MTDEKKLDAFASHLKHGSPLSRRDVLRWAGVAGVGGLGLGLSACSDPPEQELVDSTVQPTALRLGGTINGKITGLLNGDNVSGALIEVVGVGTTTSDPAGDFRFRLEESGDFELVISAGGFLTRRTAIRVTGNLTFTASLIESDTKLTEEFLNQFVRGTGPVADFAPPTPGAIARWRVNPTIRLYTRLPDGTKLGDSRISSVVDVINDSFSSFTAGRLGSATIVNFDEAPPADPSQLPIGVLCFWQTADGSQGAGQARRVDDQYEIASASCFTGTETSTFVLRRVFGQALGATVVDASMRSVMNPNGRGEFSEQDTPAAQVLYDRAPGNTAPDTDPSGFFIAGG